MTSETSSQQRELNDPFARQVYCVLGIPVDAMSMAGLVAAITQASTHRRRLFISTPNLNFVMLAQSSPPFRESLIASDLCPADGIGVLLLCRVLGLPITTRVAGSDIPAALSAAWASAATRFKMALFGGAPGVAEVACQTMNTRPGSGIVCMGAFDPGVVDPRHPEDPATISDLNATGADFLLVALGAEKGQAWLMRNRSKITIPVISHLGATINFLAGTVQRAPQTVRRLGLEWAWRIKEEPQLARRYLKDGSALIGLMLSVVVPLGLTLRRERKARIGESLQITTTGDSATTRVHLTGAATEADLEPVRSCFRALAASPSHVTLDFQHLTFFDLGFGGLLLVLSNALAQHGKTLRISNPSPPVALALKRCGLLWLVG